GAGVSTNRPLIGTPRGPPPQAPPPQRERGAQEGGIMSPDIGLANWFRERALRSPERLALRFEGRDWTYAEMQEAIEDCAARLAALGIAKGDRVAFLGL